MNWGASPGARSIMLEECFSLMRLYKIEHYIIAKYLKLILNHKELSLKKLENQFNISAQHFLYFFPDPHGQGSLGLTFSCWIATGAWFFISSWPICFTFLYLFLSRSFRSGINWFIAINMSLFVGASLASSFSLAS